MTTITSCQTDADCFPQLCYKSLPWSVNHSICACAPFLSKTGKLCDVWSATTTAQFVIYVIGMILSWITICWTIYFSTKVRHRQPPQQSNKNNCFYSSYCSHHDPNKQPSTTISNVTDKCTHFDRVDFTTAAICCGSLALLGGELSMIAWIGNGNHPVNIDAARGDYVDSNSNPELLAILAFLGISFFFCTLACASVSVMWVELYLRMQHTLPSQRNSLQFSRMRIAMIAFYTIFGIATIGGLASPLYQIRIYFGVASAAWLIISGIYLVGAILLTPILKKVESEYLQLKHMLLTIRSTAILISTGMIILVILMLTYIGLGGTVTYPRPNENSPNIPAFLISPIVTIQQILLIIVARYVHLARPELLLSSSNQGSNNNNNQQQPMMLQGGIKGLQQQQQQDYEPRPFRQMNSSFNEPAASSGISPGSLVLQTDKRIIRRYVRKRKGKRILKHISQSTVQSNGGTTTPTLIINGEQHQVKEFGNTYISQYEESFISIQEQGQQQQQQLFQDSTTTTTSNIGIGKVISKGGVFEVRKISLPPSGASSSDVYQQEQEQQGENIGGDGDDDEYEIVEEIIEEEEDEEIDGMDGDNNVRGQQPLPPPANIVENSVNDDGNELAVT
jgi:hypothetical protein